MQAVISAQSEIEISADTRRLVNGLRVAREGAAQFRREALDRDGQCLVTGTRNRATLQAAHISPYRGSHTNLLTNSLTLRADIHILFDQHLLTLGSRGRRMGRKGSPITGGS